MISSQKGLQHKEFPGDHPSKYYYRQSMLRCGVLMASGALILSSDGIRFNSLGMIAPLILPPLYFLLLTTAVAPPARLMVVYTCRADSGPVRHDLSVVPLHSQKERAWEGE
ncbi:hypothetical protein L6452_36281 [Arctium lappa]|uniref:Uncharacterized protein n=1 Tax=Arctium lappa TaxID=4217 RepID=A0ACB8Y984_ARCLA|nr:hypothetical protein L6452_36281 [Arctium lappa]